MIRLLAANGCSFTRGQELKDPATEAWPAVLATALGVPCVNLASDGASNRRIVRTTVASLASICRDASVRPDEVLVVILWTYTSRHEYYAVGHPKRFFSRNHTPTDTWIDINPWRERAGHRPSRAFYDHLWSEEGQVTNLLLDWLLLDRFLRQEGYQARYGYATPDLPVIPEPARWFVPQLPSGTTFGGVPPVKGKSFTELVDDRERGPEGHPLAEGHAIFGRTLADWLTDGSSLGAVRKSGE